MFTKEQVAAAREFGDFLNRKAKFDGLSIADTLQLVKHLQNYNKFVTTMEEHIFQVEKVVQSSPEAPTKKSKG